MHLEIILKTYICAASDFLKNTDEFPQSLAIATFYIYNILWKKEFSNVKLTY